MRPSPQPLDRRADELGALGVEVRGRLVEDDERRVAQERARERDPLALAGRERPAAVADDRLVAVRAARGRTRRPRRARPPRARARRSAAASPSRMLSATVPRKSVGRCGTQAICARQAAGVAGGEVDGADASTRPCVGLGEAEERARRSCSCRRRSGRRARPSRRARARGRRRRAPRPSRAGYANETPLEPDGDVARARRHGRGRSATRAAASTGRAAARRRRARRALAWNCAARFRSGR